MLSTQSSPLFDCTFTIFEECQPSKLLLPGVLQWKHRKDLLKSVQQQWQLILKIFVICHRKQARPVEATHLSRINSILNFLPSTLVFFGQQTVWTFINDWVIRILYWQRCCVYCWWCICRFVINSIARIRVQHQRIIISRAAHIRSGSCNTSCITLGHLEKCYRLLT